MGFIFGSIDGNGDVVTYKIGWVDLDNSQSNNATRNLDYLYGVINSSDAFDLSVETNDTATTKLEEGDLHAYVIFPEGFELYINGTGPATQPILIYFKASASDITRSIISQTIVGSINGIINYNPTDIYVISENKNIGGKEINSITQGTPGYIMYGILSSITGGVILLTSERKDGQLKRLESSKITPKDMMLGYFITYTVIILMQTLIGIINLSLFGFKPAYSDIFSLLVGNLIVVILMSFFQNALGLVCSAMFKTPEAAGGGVWVILFPLMTFSGAYFPIDVLLPNLLPYISWLPTRIVVVLFQDLMVNAVSFFSWTILLPCIYLIIQSIILFFIGNKMYKKFAQSTD